MSDFYKKMADQGIVVESLGRRATFLIPSTKVYNDKHYKEPHRNKGKSIARKVHRFLLETFGGYTCATGNIYGYFTSAVEFYDELREFRVAFKEDEKGTKIPLLLEFLSEICEFIDEECIYVECGEDALLVYPKKGQ